MTRLYLVTGASGKLGGSFVDTLKKGGNVVYAVTRKPIQIDADAVLVTDLLIEAQIENVFQNINLSSYAEVILIHTVGKFKFEDTAGHIADADGDGIDDEVYRTNVLTTKNVLKHVSSLVGTDTKLKICVFASVSDKHNVPYWSSYTRAKNVLRGYLQELCEQQRVSALVVNVSTVDTGNEGLLRPSADKTYWLRPDEVVERVLPEIEDISKYKEIDFVKEKPNFDPNYYVDHEAILEKWRQEMGVSEQIESSVTSASTLPHGN